MDLAGRHRVPDVLSSEKEIAVPERHPGWVTGINDFEARLASGTLVYPSSGVDALDPLRVRSGIKDAGGNPGQVVWSTNKVTVNPFQAVIQDPSRPALGP